MTYTPPIIKIWDPNDNLLHTVCFSLEVWTQLYVAIQQQLNSMLEWCRDPKNRAVWLALPQVWVPRRWFVVSVHTQTEKYNGVFINPVLIKMSGNITEYEEECLSEPWVKVNKKRPYQIRLEYDDPSLPTIRKQKTFTGFTARVIQHELDHLDWILLSNATA